MLYSKFDLDRLLSNMGFCTKYFQFTSLFFFYPVSNDCENVLALDLIFLSFYILA